jgi:hypothetical protein
MLLGYVQYWLAVGILWVGGIAVGALFIKLASDIFRASPSAFGVLFGGTAAIVLIGWASSVVFPR